MLQASSDAATTLRVLVVDDSAVLRDHVRMALEGAGLTVVGEAADGAHALTQASTSDPDVVLMDLRMPGMDGIQAALALRKQQPQLRVVLWTGQDDTELASAIRQSGAHAGIAKGTRTGELVATLLRVCQACPRPRQRAG
jgi:DNA-binding NarL/FixJ family response regulator